jgi:hypothetical protein
MVGVSRGFVPGGRNAIGIHAADGAAPPVRKARDEAAIH